MAEAATASPPSSYFPARTLTLRNTHTDALWPANDTHPAALEMYAFTYDTRRWRGLELKFLKQ